MATLKSKSKKFELKQTGLYYASSLHWALTNRFYLDVEAGFQITLSMSNTTWKAVYYGPTSVHLNHPKFIPDQFYLQLKPAGRFNNAPPSQPSPFASVEDLSEHLARQSVVENHYADLDKLRETKGKQV